LMTVLTRLPPKAGFKSRESRLKVVHLGDASPPGPGIH
jgi:hypothetical protein